MVSLEPCSGQTNYSHRPLREKSCAGLELFGIDGEETLTNNNVPMNDLAVI